MVKMNSGIFGAWSLPPDGPNGAYQSEGSSVLLWFVVSFVLAHTEPPPSRVRRGFDSVVAVLYLALSCLQGRPMQGAFDELASVGAVGLQLTPGNHPTADFEQHVGRATTRRHHGFDFTRRRREVWGAHGQCLVDAESVHPPGVDTPAAAAIEASGGLGPWLEARGADEPLLETMYPGWLLGSGAAIEDAMRLGVPLAVDVSHVFIQLCAGVMRPGTWRRLAAYRNVREVHVSANSGTHDAHAPLTSASFGLDWARERLKSGTPTILECYMHRLSPAERAAQTHLLTGET
jgi:hypothetical protein